MIIFYIHVASISIFWLEVLVTSSHMTLKLMYLVCPNKFIFDKKRRCPSTQGVYSRTPNKIKKKKARNPNY